MFSFTKIVVTDYRLIIITPDRLERAMVIAPSGQLQDSPFPPLPPARLDELMDLG